ncbi:unnamed protein product [Trifolium pratense]|uniref:Uncharacterized protein n=1 Tax=Trifolium pratense TaxID=57577 RepID=A0ACB0J987_TRIPR|nr:unnamed protein product [Trifolium pratense]
MASFLTDLVKPYVEKLINGAITESSYICCFTCIAKDFEDEKTRFEVERTTFNQRVDEATRRGENVQANALLWKKEAEELIQEDTKTKQNIFFGFCCDCIWRYRRGKELANKKEQIKILIKTGKELAIGLPAHLPDVERYSSQHYIPFESRESKYKELLDALNDDKNYIVGLQGMGGTGKTTLAKEVGKELKRSNQFTHVIDTTVSFSPDIKKIQDDIAGPLGLNFDDCNESDRPKKLWRRLTNDEKILLILDDVWGDIDFNDIGIPHIDNHKGCRVFVTTRYLWVCNRLGCSKTIQLDLLSEEDTWIMFQRHAGLSEISTKNLLDKGRKIANECKRLPVAIAAIASSLKGEQRQEEWDVALNSLQKHMAIGGVESVDNDLVDTYKCLKFSYDYLKDEKAKKLFLLCSVFPEDEEIPTNILTRLGIGVGLFEGGYDKYNNARNLLVVAKNKLLDSCLLLKTDEGDVKMHDLVREVAQWIANKEILAVNFSNKNQKSLVGRNNIKYLLFDGSPNDLCPTMFDGSKLEILILSMVTGCFVDSFFENIAGLRVLILILTGEEITISLPRSIRSLTNIRSLLVKCADLGDISVLGNLQSLQTLDLIFCMIDELPQEISNLKGLRLLNLELCSIENNNPFEVIQRCQSLEELYFSSSFNDFCQEITLPTSTLERYHLIDTISDSSLSKCVSLYNDYLSEETFKHVMQTAEHLKLKRIKKGWRNIMPEIVPIDQGMNDLIKLHLSDDSQLQFLVDTKHTGSQVPNVFSKLVVLKLNEMENLEELCNGPISFDSMNNLEKLTIRLCGNLRSLFKGNLNLCNLKTVKIERCSTLVSVFHLSTSGSLPLLEELVISECHNLENIFTYERRVDDSVEEILVPKLKVVKINHCDKLTYIFEQEVKLDSLIELELKCVSNFIGIFPESYHSIERSSNSISKPQTELQVKPLKSNIIFSWSPICCCRYKLKGSTSTKVPLVSENQPQACSISTETSSYCPNIWERARCLSRLSHIMCNIKEIILEKVSKIKSVSIATKMLSLESLRIYDCDELEHIVVDAGDGSGGNKLGNVFPKLKDLYVFSCEKLKYIFGHINASDDQNSNEIQLHLPALKTLKFRRLSRLMGMSPKQYHITFLGLKELDLKGCSQVDVKSIVDSTFPTSISRYHDSTTIKQFNGNMEHFLALESLKVDDSNVESILCLNDESEREIDLGLQEIILKNLPMMLSIFVGLKNVFALKNLKRITVFRCEKLEIVFSTSVLRCLSKLSHLTIEECNELKHIIEDDIENAMSSKTCFPVLKSLTIVKCNKLKSVFPISMKKELPELKAMLIEECNELKHIIEDDIENAMSSKTCFPVLKSLAVVKCNKLKSVFPISVKKELPELKIMMIVEADELEEIFKSVGDEDHKVVIPNLKVVAFLNLPSICHDQGIQFQAVANRFVQNCKKLSLRTSLKSGTNIFDYLIEQAYGIDNDVHEDLRDLFRQLEKISKDCAAEIEVQVTPEHMLTSSQKEINRTPEAEHGFNENVPNLEIPTNSKELTSEESRSQHLLGEIDTTIKLSQGDFLEGSMSTISETRNVPPIHLVDLKQKGTIQVSVEEGTASTSYANTITSSTHLESLEGYTSEKTEAATMSTISEPKNEPDSIKISVEDGTTPANAKTITSSQEQNVDVRDFQETKTKTNNDQVSLNGEAFMRVSSIIEEQFSKDDPSPSNRLPLPFSFETLSMPVEGNPSKKVEDSPAPMSIAIPEPLTIKDADVKESQETIMTNNNHQVQGNPSQIMENSSSIVIWELEQLVSKNCLDYENLSLLTDFLVKHPSVLLRDTSLGNKYKGYAYICLAELLQFLQTHSVLDVLGSSHSKFVELLQEVRSFGFDKDWLDSVERRALFSDIQVSQDALQKLLESKQQVSKEVEVLRMKIDIFNQHVEDLKHQLTSSEAVLESIIQQEAQILETKAALSAPLGY